MIQIPEYDPSNTDTLKVLKEYDVISPSEVEKFREELISVAGRTIDGQPKLRMVWGPTHIDEMSADSTQIKYLDFVHNGIQLGERRFFIEIHRSPEFLIRSGRYQLVNEPDGLTEKFFCKACDKQLADPEKPCPKCGSTRNILRQVRERNGAQILKDFPRQGCYDYWLRLERKNLTYHPPDGEALEVIRHLWAWETNPQYHRDALAQADQEIKRRQLIQQIRQQKPTNLHFSAGVIPARF